MLFDARKLLLITGPCALESEEIVSTAARAASLLQAELPQLTVVFKGSFDKANRTSLASPRGPGLERGLEMLAAVKKRFKLPVLTDIHLPEQAVPAADVCDVLQIPAFLCRQTDLLVAAAKTGRVVNVKKGQFLSPQEMRYIVRKLEDSRASEIWLTERGTTFGYQNLVVDMRNFAIMRSLGHPVILDGTHAVQMPGGRDGTTGGNRELVPVLARAGIAAGADGLFLEAHPDPDSAISDAANQLRLETLPGLVRTCLAIRRAMNGI